MIKNRLAIIILMAVLSVLSLPSCTKREKIDNLAQLSNKEFAVPMGTMADKLVLSRFPNAKFKYYNNVIDAVLAVKTGKVDAAAYDEPILRNIAGKHPDLIVLDEMITLDSYGFAVRLGDTNLKNTIDEVLTELRLNGIYDDMLDRWLPNEGSPADMPSFHHGQTEGVLRFGTSAITEPFSFMKNNTDIVGLDIEIANYIAMKLNMRLEVINMDFGALIPALMANRVDIIGACITISDERAKSVLFSEPYYIGGIAALVKK